MIQRKVRITGYQAYASHDAAGMPAAILAVYSTEILVPESILPTTMFIVEVTNVTVCDGDHAAPACADSQCWHRTGTAPPDWMLPPRITRW